jgi:hypothetical protein
MLRISPANARIYRVEPRGFEPLTSAVQMLAHGFSLVSGRRDFGIDRRISLIYRQWKLAIVNPGRCHVTVNLLSELSSLQTAALWVSGLGCVLATP